MSSKYEKTSQALVMALVGYYHLRQKGEDPGISWVADCLPHGSLKGMSFDPSLFQWADKCPDLDMGDAVFLQTRGIKQKVKDNGWRLYDAPWAILVPTMHLYGGQPHVKNISPRRKDGAEPQSPDLHDRHYVYHYEDLLGHTAQRLIANAGPAQEVELDGYHRDIRMGSLLVVPGTGRTWKTREDAITEALRLHRVATDKLGISAQLYEAMLRQFFKDLDDRHRHKLRSDPSLTLKAAAE